MAESSESIYDIEFKDIYEIEFLDVRAGTIEATEAVEGQLENINIEEQILVTSGSVAVSEATIIEPLVLDNTGPASIFIPTEVSATDGSEKEKGRSEVEVPEAFQKNVTEQIDALLDRCAKPLISYTQITDSIFRTYKKAGLTNSQIVAAITQDGRLEFFRDGCYLVISRTPDVMALYEAGKNPFVDLEHISELVELVLMHLQTNDGHAYHTSVMGAVKRLGEYLNPEEVNEFMAQFSSHKRVVPLATGNFTIQPLPEVEVAPEVEILPPGPEVITVADIQPLGLVPRNGKSVTPKQVKRAIKSIDYSPEGRASRDLAQRRANPRRRGKNFRKGSGKRSQGKAHGKKLDVEQLIERMNQMEQVKKDDRANKRSR